MSARPLVRLFGEHPFGSSLWLAIPALSTDLAFGWTLGKGTVQQCWWQSRSARHCALMAAHRKASALEFSRQLPLPDCMWPDAVSKCRRLQGGHIEAGCGVGRRVAATG